MRGDLDHNKLCVIRSFYYKRTMPFVAEKGEERQIHGTGTFFEINNRLYIITAAHVAQSIPQYGDYSGVPSRESNADILTLANSVVYLPK